MSKHSVVVKWSDSDNGYIATVPELEGLSAFGSTQEEAVKELSEAKKLYLEVLEEDGEEIPEPDVLKPYSGKLRLRLPRELHASLSESAKHEGISLNSYIVFLLSERNALRRVRNDILEMRYLSMFAQKSVTRPYFIAGHQQLEDENTNVTLVGHMHSPEGNFQAYVIK